MKRGNKEGLSKQLEKFAKAAALAAAIETGTAGELTIDRVKPYGILN